MNANADAQDAEAQPRSLLGWGVLAAMIAVFVAIVGWVSLSLRDETRRQLMARDAYVLNLMVQNQIAQAEEENLIFTFEQLSQDDLWASLLESAGAQGVFAARLYAPNGEWLNATTPDANPARLPEEVLVQTKEGSARSEYYPDGALPDFGAPGLGEERRFPTLAVFVPLRAAASGELLGIAEFLLDGRTLGNDFAVLDRRLAQQMAAAVGSGATLLVVLFWFAWRRLEASKVEIAQQAQRLRKANVELALLARTSAIGSIAAHLIHGLKNPLAGLRQVVSARTSGANGWDESEWADANEAANRMQSMVQEVVSVLQDSSDGAGYEMDLSDLEGEVRRRFGAVAESLGIHLETERIGAGSLDGHRANIALLIISNLVQNALDVLTAGQSAAVHFAADRDRLIVTVRDTGPGIAAEQRNRLFFPTQSGKPGGSGIGLAISRQLAQHIGATLQCLATPGAGAVFELCVPLARLEDVQSR